MGYKARINEAVKGAVELNKDALEKFIASLPETVEEVKTMKTMSGADIIAECLAKGDTAGASQHDSTKTYGRYYTTLRVMDHKANAMTAYRRKGMAGLKSYQNKVLRQAFYIKGKYPQFFTEDTGAPEPKATLWDKFKNIFAIFILFIMASCNQEPKHSVNVAEKAYGEYREGVRIGRLMTYAKVVGRNAQDVMRKDSIRIYNTYQR